MVQREVGERFAAAPGHRRPTASPACSPSSRATCACTARSRARSSIRCPTSTRCSSSLRPHRPGAAARAARARARRLRPPPQGARALARAGARATAPTCASAPARRSQQLGHPADERAERLAPEEFRALAEALRRVTRRCDEHGARPRSTSASSSGPTRADGRHELVTVFQPIDAGRRGRARARPASGSADGPRRSARAWRARTSPPWRCARFRERTGWNGRPGAPADREAHPGRGRDGRRQRRRGRRPAARRARARGSTTTRCCARSRAGLGADVAAQVRPRRYLATGAGERLTPLPPPAPYGVLVLPVARASCRPPTSTARPTARACRATRPTSPPGCARSSHRGRRPARRADRQRPRARGAGAVPGDRRRARRGRAARAPTTRWCADRARR